MAVTRHLEMITPLDGSQTGLKLRDNIHNRRVSIYTPETVTPESVTTDGFVFPVEEAASVETTKLEFSGLAAVFIRDSETTEVIDRLTQTGGFDFTSDTPYLLELQTFVRTYIRIPAGTTTSIRATANSVTIQFDRSWDIEIGVRSQHSRPIGEITTTTKPEDVMSAVETFGAALQTRSPERSWPTLRGHPPRITIGDTLDIPESLQRPDVDIKIGVPPSLSSIYAVTPLVFYLGAQVTPASAPHVSVSGRRVHEFENIDLGREAGRFLKHVFTLDCVTRSAGLYDMRVEALFELSEILDMEDSDWHELYNKSPERRLQEYTEIPREPVLDAAPRWRHEVYVGDSARPIEHLPFLADDLAVVREVPRNEPDPAPKLKEGVNNFFRGTAESAQPRADSKRGSGVDSNEFVGLPKTSAGETSYVGNGVPIDGAKLMREAYEARFDQSATEDISVQVVCNEDDMWSEYSEFPLYGNRGALEFDVSVTRNASREELSDLLATAGDADFFHYIGHVRDGTRFVCRDGELGFNDVATFLSPPRVFLLNGCSSYELGREFIEAGSQAGIITLSPIANSSAMLIGQCLARLINQGFPPRSALEVVQKYGRANSKYLTLGDAGHEVAQSESGVPIVVHLDPIGGPESDRYSIALEMFPAANDGMGGVVNPDFSVFERRLFGGFTEVVETSADEAQAFVDLDYRMPIVMDGELTWSTQVEL